MRAKEHKKQVPFYKRHWGLNEERYHTRIWHHVQKAVRFERPRFWWQEHGWWHRFVALLIACILIITGVMYGVARWYITSQSRKPLQLGTTFIPRYAEYFGLDPKETLHAILYDAGIRHVRLVSYWDDIEKKDGEYNFDELDWQFRMAEDTGAKVSLAVGLRQPRWPECHMPDWAGKLPKDQWSIHLKTFMAKVINRYKDSPSLENYQLENEYFMRVFGICPDFSRDRLVDEFNFVKTLDVTHPIVISRSNNAVGIPLGKPLPDTIGVSVYKRVWDKAVVHRYFEYPFPAWFYGFLAGSSKLITGRDMIIHELQAEPWVPPGYDLNTTPISEQDKSINAKRLRDRIQYGKATGMKSIDLWGAEWWYWRKVKFNDPSLWNVVKNEVQKVQNTNSYL